jgi:hypothetical protein
VRAAEATEAIAVEVFRQCECSGQPVSMAVINRALHQLRSHRPACSCGLGYSRVRGLNALLATVAGAAAPVIVAQRLRKGSCGSARGGAFGQSVVNRIVRISSY